MTKDGVKLVLKAAKESQDSNPSVSYIKTLSSREQGLTHLHFISNHTSFNQTMFNRFLTHINFDGENLLAQLWTGELLLHQEEYLKLNELQDLNLVPKLYGACGRYYISQFTPIDNTVNVNNLRSGLPWTSVGK